MNVTNRCKTTDADTPTTQTNQQQQQQQHQQSPLLAYVSCRQAATASDTGTSANRTRRDQLQHFSQIRDTELEDDEQDQVVTSTSSDCLLPLTAEGEGEEVTLELEALVTSPACISSSTNNYEILMYNSDSLSLEEMVMPSTSENLRLERAEGSTTIPGTLENKPQQSINSTRSLKLNHTVMVARDTTPLAVVDAGGRGGGIDSGEATTSSNINTDTANESHKIILKLPKPPSVAPESHQFNSPTDDDVRKVEPLKINLHSTHSHSQHHTPKITIKPIVKETSSDVLGSSEECSSSAEDEIVTKLNASEPHILPKLTIRAKNEEHSTIVPKLTIKINDTNNPDVHNSTQPAANTPPLPKLTIKTGQDGQSESIITNISPASSTTSSSCSSLASSSTSSSLLNINSISTNVIPKLTIKPVQKCNESAANEHHPSIPKLCIKGNMICPDMNNEETSNSKIPKLTIKTGQEHAVIITQRNDHVNNLGGIPKLTIKTKSLDMIEDSPNSLSGSLVDNISTIEKIPKITIKTSNTNTNSLDSTNIIVGPKRSVIKTQYESSSSPSSPKQAVPKLTISRQQNDMVVTNKHSLNEDESSVTIPKMTIKTQNKLEIVPKLTIKNISSQQRPSSTEESGISDNAEDEESPTEDLMAQHCKTVPKLTIKNLGSPQQKLTVVQEPTVDTMKTNISSARTTTSLNSNQPVSSPVDADEFSDLLTVDNGGGESSNSQGFCGFNENTVDDSASKVVILTASSDIRMLDNESEVRRNSDDMDIDEDLQTRHEPQIFQNVNHFKKSTDKLPELLNGKMDHQKVIDMVDLTSSPSCSSSPAHYNDYNDDNTNRNITNSAVIPSTNILLERLQRETSVIQNTQQSNQQIQQMESTSTIPPPLQPKPNATQAPPTSASLKYPQLAERLMANGTTPNAVATAAVQPLCSSSKEEHIIDSIEILDTPEGSPRNSIDEFPENMKTTINEKNSFIPNGIHYTDDSKIPSHSNNNSHLKRHAVQSNLAGPTNYSPDENKESVPPAKQRRLNSNDSLNTKNLSLNVNNNNDFINQKVLINSLGELNKSQQPEQHQLSNLNNSTQIITSSFTTVTTSTILASSHQRARKQKHDNLIPIPMDEVVDSMQNISNDSYDFPPRNPNLISSDPQSSENSTPIVRKRGRPKRVNNSNPNACNEIPQTGAVIHNNETTTPQTDMASKSRRVQLLRKRLAIDMVDADEPLRVLDEMESNVNNLHTGVADEQNNENETDSQRKDRSLRNPLRTSRRSNTPTVLQVESKTKIRPNSSLAMDNGCNKKSLQKQNNENILNHYHESNSSISSICSNSSATLTSTTASAMSCTTKTTLSMATQIDLTMSSSSSSSNGSTTNTITTVEATLSSKRGIPLGMNTGKSVINVNSGIGNDSSNASCGNIGGSGGSGGSGSSNNTMLPPTMILSSEPLPDVIFKSNDFSSILATQQLRAPVVKSSMDNLQTESQEEDVVDDVSGPDNSGGKWKI